MTTLNPEQRIIRIDSCYDCDPYKNLGTWCGKDRSLTIHGHVFHKTIHKDCPLEKVEEKE